MSLALPSLCSSTLRRRREAFCTRKPCWRRAAIVAASGAAVCTLLRVTVADSFSFGSRSNAWAPQDRGAARRDALMFQLSSLSLFAGEGEAIAEDQMPMERMDRLGKAGTQRLEEMGKRRQRLPNFELLPSGLQVKEMQPPKEDADGPPGAGDTAVITWEGYTINYFGRPFETKKLQDVEGIVVEPFRFKVGDGTVIPAIDEAVRKMKEGSVYQLIVPVELGYDAEKQLQPRPATFSGQRALDFVMDNTGGLMDKTLLINILLKRIYRS